MIKIVDTERPFNPVPGLWVAVLEQAIKDAQGKSIAWRRAKNRSQKIKLDFAIRNKKKAIYWLLKDNGDTVDPAPGSFLWICGLLNLDPDVTRQGIRAKL